MRPSDITSSHPQSQILDGPFSHADDVDPVGSLIVTDGLDESLEQGCSHIDTLLEDQSSALSSTIDIELNTAPTICLPLLSPFSSSTNESSPLIDFVKMQPTLPQRSLDFLLPSSSPFQSTSLPPATILQPPFGEITQSVPTTPKLASIPSSPQNCLPYPTEVPDPNRTEPRNDSSSDSIEITIKTPSTPTATQDTSEETSSPPIIAKEKEVPEMQVLLSTMHMAQDQQLQGPSDITSSALQSQNLELEALKMDMDAPSSHTNDVETDGCQIIEDELDERLEQGGLSVDERPLLENQSNELSSAIGTDSNSISTIFQPLLSPFISSTNDSVEMQSTRPQRSLDFLPSSPPFQPASSNSESSPPATILQPPFGGIVRSVSSIPSSPQNCLPSPESSPICAPEPNESANLRTEPHDGRSSESVEITIDTPSTTAAVQDTSEETSSTPTIAKENEKEFAETQVVCLSMDDVMDDDVTKSHIPPVLELSSSTLQETFSNSITSEEKPMKATRPRPASEEGPSVPTPPSHNSSPSKSPQPTSQEPSDKSTPQKRPLELDGLDHAPAPKRMTLASQKKQHKKLASPFRSPLLSKPNPSNISTPERARAALFQPSPLSSLPGRDDDEDKPSTPLKKIDSRTTSTTPRLKPGSVGRSLFTSVKATAQFKSPIKSSTSPNAVPRSTTSRDIQELERKAQLLKRAIKIKKDEDEEKLEQLVKKWRGVGREAAWELWQIVRDNDQTSDATYPGTSSKSQAGPSSSSWGWADQAGSGNNDGNWGWDQPPGNGTGNEEEEGTDTSDFESPEKLERRLYQTLSKKPTAPRTSMLPPTPRGAYFERRATCQDYDEVTCTSKEEEEEEQHSTKPAKSLGTMLHQIGIAHETLGWVEDEGDFVDA